MKHLRDAWPTAQNNILLIFFFLTGALWLPAQMGGPFRASIPSPEQLGPPAHPSSPSPTPDTRTEPVLRKPILSFRPTLPGLGLDPFEDTITQLQRSWTHCVMSVLFLGEPFL
jgi:hypothetical protein